MCGRFTQISSPSNYAQLFSTTTELTLASRFNVAPNSDIVACRLTPGGNKELVLLHWGLVPSWSKGLNNRYSMINARAETVATKPAYRAPFRHHRCLIPADGFYEWHAENGKQPYYIHRKNNSPLVFAGLWEHWDDDDGAHIESCTIIVCEANSLMSPIHQRMPVILRPAMYDSWLSNNNLDYLQSILISYAQDDLEMYPVSRAVNNPKNDWPDLVDRLTQ